MAGLDAELVAFGVMGLAASDPDLVRVCYAAMGLLGDVSLMPIATSTLATGVILSLGTPWELLRYRWVAGQFVVIKPWGGCLVVGRLRRESGGIRR